jgi:LL-diaminopimelate aminotransferase
MFINYPNNPTAAVANKDFFKKVVKFAKKYDILVCHDFAYSEMTFDDYKASSFLEVKGAKEVGIEFHSLSKIYNMTGWRLGFAVGNAEAISALSIIKTNIDSGVFKAIQEAGIEALTGPQDNIEKMNKIYTGRRNVVINGLNKLGWNLKPTKATFYIWIPTLNKMDSMKFSNLLLEKAGIIVTPGIGYGEYGEGYVRIALTVNEKRLEEAMKRMEKAGITQE